MGYETNSFIYIIDLNNFSLKYVDLGTPVGFYFTLLYPPEVFDLSSKYIACSDISIYNIKILDNDGKFLFNIHREDSLFNKLDSNLHKKFANLVLNQNITIKSALDSIRSTFFSGIGIIEKVSFVNDSTLLIRWYGPKKDTTSWYPDIYYDIWEIKKDSALLVGKNILAKLPNDSTLMKFEPLYSSRFECASNYIISFYTVFCEDKGPEDETLQQFRIRQKKLPRSK